MKIQFLGAAGQVTGSMTLLTYNGYKILIDCGQFQGSLAEETLNYKELSFDVRQLDCIILTHAHIDHTGRIPLLVKNGFTGKIFCTPPTSHLAEILLKDSGKIHETEAAWENKKRKRAGLDPVEPLFTEDDAVESIQYLYPIHYETSHVIHSDLSFEFVSAGHLLGSASLILHFTEEGSERTLVFSGDLGNSTSLIEEPPVFIKQADYLIVESTYGNRIHENIHKRTDELVDLLIHAYARGGTVLIPSFAVGRTQEIIFELNYFMNHCEDDRTHTLSEIPIYIDSPLALEATKIYEHHLDYMGKAVQEFGPDAFKMHNLHLVTSIEGSIALNRNNNPKVIISASGMCEAGRITHHLKHNLWKADTYVIFIGYQAEGTLGRRLLNGEKQVTIMDSDVAVHARLFDLHGFSGHADKDHLHQWIRSISGLKKIFVNHGETASRDTFSQEISEYSEAEIILPNLLDEFIL